jgi:hypothetical protein
VAVELREDFVGWLVGLLGLFGDGGVWSCVGLQPPGLPLPATEPNHPPRPAAHAAAFHLPPRGAAPGATAASGT